MEGCDKLSQVNVRQTYNIRAITREFESERNSVLNLHSLAITLVIAQMSYI